MMQTLLICGFLLVLCVMAYVLRALTATGAFAALITGLLVYLGFDVAGLILLGAFFVTSSFWSEFKRSAKKSMEEKLAKGATRDWRQVAANGGAAAIFSLLYSMNQDITWFIGFAVCLASSNSDTWASEIGSLSRKKPFFIRTFKRVDRGTSGAVSVLGTVAALAGSSLIALLSYWLFDVNPMVAFLIFIFGWGGNIIDTIIGAYYQQLFVCQKCGLETERHFHCQLPASRIKGFAFIDNDMVNFLSGLIASVLAIIIAAAI